MPSFALSYVQYAPQALEGGVSRHAIGYLDEESSACGWPILLKGQSAKGLASKASEYTSVELALSPLTYTAH